MGLREGGSGRQRLDITVQPPGECLQNLITLNGITLLDLWMDVSHSPRRAAAFTILHTPTPPHL